MDNKELINITKCIPFKSESKAFWLYSYLIDNDIKMNYTQLYTLLVSLGCSHRIKNDYDIFDFDDYSYFILTEDSYGVGYKSYYGIEDYELMTENLKGYNFLDRWRKIKGSI